MSYSLSFKLSGQHPILRLNKVWRINGKATAAEVEQPLVHDIIYQKANAKTNPVDGKKEIPAFVKTVWYERRFFLKMDMRW